MKNLHVFVGLSSSGKTTYCIKKFGDDYSGNIRPFEYAELNKHITNAIYLIFDTMSMSEIIGRITNAPHGTNIIIDQLESMDQLKEIQAKTSDVNICVYLVYTYIDELMRLRLERYPDLYKNGTKKNVINAYRDILKHIKQLYKNHTINNYTFVFRNKNKYVENKDFEWHFLHILDDKSILKSEKKLLGDISARVEGPHYQSIVLNGKQITESIPKDWVSLENILKTGISFQNKTVLDVGCWYGYFSFRLEELGAASVYGVDMSDDALYVAKEIARINNSSCAFSKFQISNSNQNVFAAAGIDKANVTLILNMIHHVRRLEGENAYFGLLNIVFNNSNEVVFEINDREMADVKTTANKCGYKLVYEIKSHRHQSYEQRYVLYFRRK